MLSMDIWRKIFPKKRKALESYDFDLSNQNGNAISDFSKLDADNRMIRIMKFGDTGNLKYFDLMIYSIQFDTDIDVKFAALKRIHLFKDHPSLKSILNKMNEDKSGDTLEPYFSMALSRLGIITLEEFKNKINSSNK